MKVLIVFVFCILHVSFGQDGILKNFQPRPLHKPEAQNNPVIIPIYTPVQQYPMQQYPQFQQYPIQQYPAQQFVPVQHFPMQYPQYQHYPHVNHYYPQFSHGIPC